MEDELWLKKIKERLEDHSEPLPTGGWERLEKELAAPGTPTSAPRRMLLFRRWAVAAAAALLVAVSSVSLWLMQGPVGDEVRRTTVPTLAAAPDALPAQAAPSGQTTPATPAARAQATPATTPQGATSLWMARHEASPAAEATQDKPLPTPSSDKAEAEAAARLAEEAEAEKGEADSTAPSSKQDEAREERYRPSDRNKLHLPDERPAAKASKGWAVGLSVGNTGGFSLANEGGEADLMMDAAPGSPIHGSHVDLSSTANGILTIPGWQELVFKDGMPYLMRRGKRIADIDHKQPVSFGVSVRKNLAKGFSVESGLTYTYLASDIRYEGSTEQVSQKLHYIGLPLRANWNFVDTKRFTAYISAGGAIEKCVYGKIGTESETVKPVQFSVMGAVGAQYNVSRRVGLYVEPGVSYFFDDGSPVQTIRKENPCNFTLQAGVRLVY